MSELLPSWEAWAGVCRLLGHLWLREPDAATLHELNQEPLRTHFLDAGGWLPPSLAPERVSQWTQRLAEEYCRLFIGPRGHRPAVQSVWQQEQFQAEPAAAMHAWWELLGWKPQPAGSQPPPDHLGLQWLTLGYLFSLCAMAQQRRPAFADEEELLHISARFVHRHLLWAEPLCRWVCEQAREPFYRHLASMSLRFLDHVKEQLAGDSP